MIAALRIGITLALCGAALVGNGAEAAPQPTFDTLANSTKQAIVADPKAALALAVRMEEAARSLPADRQRDASLVAQRLQGEAKVRLDRLDEALTVLNKALPAAHAGPNRGTEADILISLGNAHDVKGELAAALRDYQSAYALYRRVGDARSQALALTNISALYGDANDYRSVLKYLDQAIAVYQKDPGLLLPIYVNRGLSLQDLGRYKEAENAYRKALPLARVKDSPLLEARILGNIARVRLKLNDEPSASASLRQAFALTAAGGAAMWRPQLVAIAAQAAYQRHDYRAARSLIEQRFTGVDPATTTIAFREAHQTAYDTYRALGDAPRAIDHLAALKRLDDQATRLATSANSALASARFDYDNQKLRITTLQRDDANRKADYERERARTERLVFLGIAIATAIIIALLGVWLATVRRSRNRVKAVADDLAVTNTALGKALAAKTEFLATTSHEIRTPLNGILGMTQVMLADPKLAADARDRIGVVHGAGVTMRALVDDILDVAKMETGNLTVEHAPFDLAATLTEAARMWTEQARAKGVDFVLDLAACPHWIEGDAARVRQIAFNLMSNALKFTAEGRISLGVEGDGDRYRIAVTDSGIGIAADKLEAIFESFKQADAGTTRRFGGTGLGLAICRNLARAMGGEVEVASVPGQGSTFTAVLPLAVAQAPAAAGAAAASGDDAARVVIVDANPISRAMLKALLAGCDAGVTAVAALDQVAGADVDADVILIDQNAVTDEEMLADFARTATAPLAVLWRGQPPDPVSRSARIIAKPIAGPALLALIREALPQRSVQSVLVQRAA